VLRPLAVLAAKLRGRPVALCDGGDVDGLVCAALFKRAYPNGAVVLGAPSDVRRLWVRAVPWDFVADLPCPPRARLRADHHKTNAPCAEVEFYDPDAPAAAALAVKALGLEGDPLAQQLVDAAVQADTASVTDRRVWMLDLAIRYASYGERLAAVELLARKGLSALDEGPLASTARRGLERHEIVRKIVERIPPDEALLVYSPRSLGVSYRLMVLELERRGSKFVNVLVRRGLVSYRLYCGAHRNSGYDCAELAARFGGGGHRYAAGATIRAPLLRRHKPLHDLFEAVRPRAVYVLGACSGLKLPCMSVWA
jgi:hypothetical protein